MRSIAITRPEQTGMIGIIERMINAPPGQHAAKKALEPQQR
jgi:hypothetical protein